ncbi:DNA-directed primase/polymerase protein [Aphelenchoides besseyi]|nr:DNA-directed primase/polymerase protein [Aphelenchoides besseyi]
MSAIAEEHIRKNFNVHYYQQDAFNEQGDDRNKRIFAYEIPNCSTGARRFFTSDLPKFVEFYKNYQYGRHFYELIQSDRPCRAYFDLEFYTRFNPNINGVEYIKQFMELCCEMFDELFKIKLNQKNFLLLDSSTPEKFSAHMIILLPQGQLFQTNQHLKPVIDMLCQRMVSQQKCLVKNDDRVEPFCDVQVYSRNRNFRMFLSSKNTKNIKLTYADYCNVYEGRVSQMQTLYDSLVIPECYWECPLVDTSHLNVQKFQNRHPDTHTVQSYSFGGPRSACQYIHIIYEGRNENSPFPALDSYILKVISEYKTGVRIRSWTLQLVDCYQRQHRRIQYQFYGFRYCENVRREHRHQNVYWIAELEIDGLHFWQKCFKCREFSSDRWDIEDHQVRVKILATRDEVFEKYNPKEPEIIVID